MKQVISESLNQYSVRNVLLVVGASIVVAFAFYGFSSWFANLYVRATNTYYGPYMASPFPPSEVAGADAILLILGGLLLLLGSGGISLNTAKAIFINALANAMGKETVGPGEMMRREAWRPKGYKLAGLILIVAGVFSILLAFGLAHS